jgi:glyoxylate carboligase
MAKQISDLIVERLIEWGVDTIFGFPGDGVDGFFESLRTHQDKLKFIQVRHEEAAALAMPSTRDAWGFAVRRPDPAVSICSTDSTTRSAICNRYSPSRATRFPT